jgi:hypothetical protein
MAGHDGYLQEIQRLRDQRRSEWTERRRAIEESLRARPEKPRGGGSSGEP